MILIQAILVDDVLTPITPIPSNALMVVCDGVNYTVYEQGDVLPIVPIAPDSQ